MTICAEIRDSIGPWLDGELAGEPAEAVRSHLETCAACAEEQHQLARLDLVMKAAMESEAARIGATAFWNDVRQRIETRRVPWHEKLTECTRSAFRAPSFAWAVPAIILALIGALYLELFTRNWSVGAPRNNFATVESIDAYGRNVALLREHESKTTVIWLYQNPDNENEAAGEVVDKGPAF